MATKLTVPFVRGLILWFRMGDKVTLGCVGCARLFALQQTGMSLLFGWFSPFAVLINPILLIYGVGLALFAGRNPAGARKHLQDQGFPTGSEGDLQRVSYALAVQMLGGEWTREARELSGRELVLRKQEIFTPERVGTLFGTGQRLMLGFEKADLEWYVATSADLGHPLHIAQASKRILSAEQLAHLLAFLKEVEASFEFSEARKGTFEVIRKALN